APVRSVPATSCAGNPRGRSPRRWTGRWRARWTSARQPQLPQHLRDPVTLPLEELLDRGAGGERVTPAVDAQCLLPPLGALHRGALGGRVHASPPSSSSSATLSLSPSRNSSNSAPVENASPQPLTRSASCHCSVPCIAVNRSISFCRSVSDSPGGATIPRQFV